MNKKSPEISTITAKNLQEVNTQNFQQACKEIQKETIFDVNKIRQAEVLTEPGMKIPEYITAFIKSINEETEQCLACGNEEEKKLKQLSETLGKKILPKALVELKENTGGIPINNPNYRPTEIAA